MTPPLPTLADAVGPTGAAELGILAAAYALGRCAPYRARWRPWVVPVVLAAGLVALRGLALTDLVLMGMATTLALLPRPPQAHPPGRALQRWLWTDLGAPLALLAAWGVLRAWDGLANLAVGGPPAPDALARQIAWAAFGVAGYAWVCRPASEGVGALLECVGGAPGGAPGAVEGAGRARDVGWLIGILERLAVLTLTLLGQWEAIGFVLTAKSIARFRELEDRDFSELYLTGTRASVGAGAATGLALRALL